MPLPNEVLVGRFNQCLQRLFNIQGDPPAPQLASEIQPTFALPSGVEDRWLNDDRLATCALGMGAVAGDFNVSRIRNPAASGRLVIVETIFISSGGADTVDIGWQPVTSDFAQLPTPPGRQFRDSRTGAITRLPAALVTFDVSPPGTAASSLFTGQFLANTIVQIPINVILVPGWALDVATSTVNVVTRHTYLWRERTVNAMELAF